MNHENLNDRIIPAPPLNEATVRGSRYLGAIFLVGILAGIAAFTANLAYWASLVL